MVFKARAPFARPVLELALAMQEVGQVSLFVAELFADFVEMAAEVGEHIGMRAELPAVDGRIAVMRQGRL